MYLVPLNFVTASLLRMATKELFSSSEKAENGRGHRSVISEGKFQVRMRKRLDVKRELMRERVDG